MKSMYEEIKLICKEVETVKALSTVKKVTIHRNKTNPEDTIEDSDKALAEALKAGKVWADYKKVEIEIPLKPFVLTTLFGKADFVINKEVRDNIKLFSTIIAEATKATRVAKKTAEPVKDSAESVKDSEKVNKKAEKPAKENNHATATPAS